MKEYPHSAFIPSRGNDTRTLLSHGLRANLEPSAKHVIIKRNQCKGGISLLKKVLMTMALCAASAMPLVSEAKDNAGAPLLAQVEATQGKAEDTLKRPAFEDKRIEINLASRLLTLYQGDVGIRMYPIAPGKPDSPTPTGRRKVVDMEINPTWVDPDDPKTEVPSGPDCPLGYRWIGIGGNYGIHGTNVPSSIGGYASHGCVRMYEKDVEDLFDHIVKGIPVDIKYERVVAEMDPDKTVVYYVYPDGYGREPLEISDVRKKLAELGAGGLADDASIQQAIDSSDGQPRYVAKVYDLYLKGELLDVHAYGKDGHVYLPVMAVAKAAGIRTEWSPNWNRFTTTFGKAPGLKRGKYIYIDASDAPALFRLTGHLDEKHNFILE